MRYGLYRFLRSALRAHIGLIFAYASADAASQPRPAEKLRRLGRRLADIRCRARDVVRLHLNALSRFSKDAEPADQQRFLSESRLVLTELLGSLADTYLRTYHATRGPGEPD